MSSLDDINVLGCRHLTSLNVLYVVIWGRSVYCMSPLDDMICFWSSVGDMHFLYVVSRQRESHCVLLLEDIRCVVLRFDTPLVLTLYLI